MRLTNLALSLLAAAAIAGCGGSSTDPRPGDQSPKVRFAALVSFGDSLSDVGTYNVGTIKTLGGGQFNVNGNGGGELTGRNWIELLTAQFGLPAACPAMTGLEGTASLGFAVPVTQNANCYAYGQGGARVTNPVGIGNKATGSPLGALTVPVAAQISTHLGRVGGSFKGDELVVMLAGGNDALIALTTLRNGAIEAGKAAFGPALVGALAKGAPNPATAAQAIGLALATAAAKPGATDEAIVAAAVNAAALAGNTAAASPAVYGPLAAAAQATATQAGQTYFAANAAGAVTTMGTVAAELANLVKTQVVGKGAKYVAVLNLPDLAATPYALEQSAEVRTLINTMVTTFNSTLATGVAGDNRILLVDAYAVSHDQASNPAPYGLSNVKDRACDVKKLITSNSLSCTQATLVAGDVSHYLFADDVHPTPFGYKLLARYVSEKLAVNGWL